MVLSNVSEYFSINSTTFIWTYYSSKLLFHPKADGNEMLITLVFNIYTPILIVSVITFLTFTFPICPHSPLFHSLYTWPKINEFLMPCQNKWFDSSSWFLYLIPHLLYFLVRYSVLYMISMYFLPLCSPDDSFFHPYLPLSLSPLLSLFFSGHPYISLPLPSFLFLFY